MPIEGCSIFSFDPRLSTNCKQNQVSELQHVAKSISHTSQRVHLTCLGQPFSKDRKDASILDSLVHLLVATTCWRDCTPILGRFAKAKVQRATFLRENVSTHSLSRHWALEQQHLPLAQSQLINNACCLLLAACPSIQLTSGCIWY